MTSFLGVTIKVRGEVYGNLYLTNKIGWSEFTTDDVALVEALALAAGIAIESVRLHQRVQEAALYEDRSRLARDLHDTVIQQLFGIGLTLQSVAAQTSGTVSTSLANATMEIDRVIQRVRSTIYELGMSTEPRGVRDWVITLTRELSFTLGFDLRVSFAGPVDAAISDAIAEHLLATVRESVTNIGRHAGATAAWVTLAVENRLCTLTVEDNGSGLKDAVATTQSLGLKNLRTRAEGLNGSFSIESPASGGTILTWQVPVGP